MEAKLAQVQAKFDAERKEAREARKNEANARAAAIHWKEQAMESTGLLQQTQEQTVAAKDLVMSAAKRLQVSQPEKGCVGVQEQEVGSVLG
jgi:hypothetical protein